MQNYQIWHGNKYEEGLVLGVSPRTHPKGVAPALPNFGVPFYLCVHPLTQNYQIWRIPTYGEGACFSSQPHPTLKGQGPSAPQFLGFSYIYAYTLCLQHYKIWRSNTYREGLDFSGLATPRSQRGGAPVLSDFRGSSLSVTVLCKACVIILILENEFFLK